MANGDKLDTGTPGFQIPNDETAYTYDVGSEEQVTMRADPGNMTVDHAEKDLSEGTKRTLADYLRGLTSNNRYPINGDVGTYTSVSLTNEDNLPTKIAESQNTTRYKTWNDDNKGSIAGVTGDNVPAATLGSFMRKGKQAPYPPASASPPLDDGNTLLTEDAALLAAGDSNSGIKDYQSAVLRLNRFMPVSVAASTLTNLTLNNNELLKGYNPIFRHPKYGDISANRLANVGSILSIRASQELNAAKGNVDPTGASTETGALLPGGVQLGATRVDSFILEAKDVFDEGLTDEEIDVDSMLHLGSESWGSLNNVLDQYSGITALGMPLLSVALTAATMIVFELLGTIIGYVAEPGKPEKKKDSIGKYFLGRSTLKEMPDPDAFPPIPLDFAALLGIRSTIYPFGDALQEGTSAFFGVDMSNPLAAISTGLLKSLENPGFNIGIARTIIRSGILIVDAFKKAFSSPNFVAAIKNILSIIDEIRTSKFIAAMNVFSRLGDQILSQKATEDQIFVVADNPNPQLSTVDQILDSSPDASVGKNRLLGKLKLAWASNRTISTYLLPISIYGLAASTKLGGFHPGYGLQELDSRALYQATDNATRIDSAIVAKVEANLGAEYMPFYFHDLRTNEIISFHAFLASLTDEYTPNWDASEGIGRVDAVQTYKNTQRKISMSFHVIATSEPDFNDMWVKLNKLVTLVYPQYTKGRGRETPDGSYRFVQPLSQIPSVSPLIRLRLGDLVRSNYSRFALARLFGIGTVPGVTLGGSPIDISAEAPAANTFLEKKLEAKEGMWFLTSDGQAPPAQGMGISIGASTPDTAPMLKVKRQEDLRYIPMKVIDYRDGSVTVEPQLPTASDLSVELSEMSAEGVAAIISYIEKIYANSSDPQYRIIGGTYVVQRSGIVPSKSLLTLSETSSSAIEQINEFMSSENNALVKSFKDVGGKGLAGKIDSLSFNWYDQVTWETKHGSKAPKRCLVNISFTPIHDISPGLDHLGYNRSPVYPVAWYNNGQDDEEMKDLK